MSLMAFDLNTDSRELCVVCGLGLLGGAIVQELGLRYSEVARRSTSWGDPVTFAAAVENIATSFNASKLELVWSAGSAGFFASKNELDAEVNFFKTVIDILKPRFENNLCITLISSAGGIYENAGFVTQLNQTSPNRPYAFAKLEQETFLQDADIQNRIYRVSSAYGVGGFRQGLIKTLIINARTGELTKIYAQQNTLRDYIFSQDVARLVTRDIEAQDGYGVSLAASGRAISINMLLNMVRKITGRVPRVTYSTDVENSADITFSASLVRSSTSTTSLEEGLGILHKQLAWLEP